jgi:acyl dehydratase
MPVDPSKVGVEGEPVLRSWTVKDCLLYAIGVGAGTDELEFSTEKNQQVLPTFAVIMGGGGVPYREIGSFNPAMMVHGEEAIEVYRPIPPEGTVKSQGRIAGIYDKGKGGLIILESISRDAETEEPLFKTVRGLFLRGEGGFGGERGPSGPRNLPPDRKPDAEVRYGTRPEQALLYRLSGDMNPLHSDPEFARLGGFNRPILHGLCTYGFTGRALLHTLCGSDAARFRSMEGRFSKPVYPGEDLIVSMWVDGGEAIFRTTNDDGDIVLDQGRCTFQV